MEVCSRMEAGAAGFGLRRLLSLCGKRNKG